MKSKTPINDELTLKMERLLENANKGVRWRGWHKCCCGERSGTCDLLVGNFITNSLAGHYLKWHRSDVPESEIEKLRSL